MHMAGISPLESWDWTWGEGCEAVTAFNQLEIRRDKKQAVALYNAAACLVHNMGVLLQGGTPMTFEEAFPSYQEKKEEMTDEAMYGVVRALNAMYGGTEE